MKHWLIHFSKNCYLKGIQFISKKDYPSHQKILFLLSFPSTSDVTLRALYQEWQQDLVICYTKNSLKLAQEYQKKGCQIYPINHYLILLLKIVPLLKGASVVLSDNYFAFLAGISFSDKTKNVQLWHANGAIKRFGLEAEYAKKSSSKDQDRYKEVYRTWTHYVVSSLKMKQVFERNYQISVNSLDFGYPPTDYYFDQNWRKEVLTKFKQKFPTNKKVLLYAPTYREKALIIPSEFKEMLKKLEQEWIFLMKCHPHDQKSYEAIMAETKVVFDFQGMTLNEVLPSVDCLITDYSSIPFEYSLANPQGKVVFYCYDYQDYIENVGLENDFEKWAPGEIVENTVTLFKAIQTEKASPFTMFNQEWNTYAQGTSKSQLIEWVKKNNEA